MLDRLRIPGLGGWHEDPLWASVYDWTVEHPRVGGPLWRAGIGSDLDALLSVDALKMFKPRPEVYSLVTQHFGCKPGDVTFVSSNRWDVMAGISVGFRSMWINRAKLPDEYPDFAPDRVLTDLNALTELA